MSMKALYNSYLPTTLPQLVSVPPAVHQMCWCVTCDPILSEAFLRLKRSVGPRNGYWISELFQQDHTDHRKTSTQPDYSA